jgi:hypothetical protein
VSNDHKNAFQDTAKIIQSENIQKFIAIMVPIQKIKMKKFPKLFSLSTKE